MRAAALVVVQILYNDVRIIGAGVTELRTECLSLTVGRPAEVPEDLQDGPPNQPTIEAAGFVSTLPSDGFSPLTEDLR